jgi:hypothetical protein
VPPRKRVLQPRWQAHRPGAHSRTRFAVLEKWAVPPLAPEVVPPIWHPMQYPDNGLVVHGPNLRCLKEVRSIRLKALGESWRARLNDRPGNPARMDASLWLKPPYQPGKGCARDFLLKSSGIRKPEARTQNRPCIGAQWAADFFE